MLPLSLHCLPPHMAVLARSDPLPSSPPRISSRPCFVHVFALPAFPFHTPLLAPSSFFAASACTCLHLPFHLPSRIRTCPHAPHRYCIIVLYVCCTPTGRPSLSLTTQEARGFLTIWAGYSLYDVLYECPECKSLTIVLRGSGQAHVRTMPSCGFVISHDPALATRSARRRSTRPVASASQMTPKPPDAHFCPPWSCRRTHELVARSCLVSIEAWRSDATRPSRRAARALGHP